jgi:AcrR family transcriptional regulator
VGEVGYAKLSIEGIAAAAGVGKQTIYRWWPSKGSLLFDAFLTLADDGQDGATAGLPDTGDLAADLKLVLRATAAELNDPRYDLPAVRTGPQPVAATHRPADPRLHRPGGGHGTARTPATRTVGLTTLSSVRPPAGGLVVATDVNRMVTSQADSIAATSAVDPVTPQDSPPAPPRSTANTATTNNTTVISQWVGYRTVLCPCRNIGSEGWRARLMARRSLGVEGSW